MLLLIPEMLLETKGTMRPCGRCPVVCGKCTPPYILPVEECDDVGVEDSASTALPRVGACLRLLWTAMDSKGLCGRRRWAFEAFQGPANRSIDSTTVHGVCLSSRLLAWHKGLALLFWLSPGDHVPG
jgi:hypothetical protein